jgi:hypothetical protein
MRLALILSGFLACTALAQTTAPQQQIFHCLASADINDADQCTDLFIATEKQSCKEPPASRKLVSMSWRPSVPPPVWPYKRNTLFVDWMCGPDRIMQNFMIGYTTPPVEQPATAVESPAPSKIESCVAACKANTSGTPEQCFDACNH